MADYEVGARLSLKQRAAFEADARRAGRAIDDIGDQARQSSVALRTMGRIGRGVGRVGFTALKYGALGAAGAIGVIGFASVKARVEAEQAMAPIQAHIKSTGGVANVTAGHVERLSNKIMSYSGISDELIQRGSGILLTFRKVANEAGRGNRIFDRATRAAADLSVEFGGVESASKMLGKALNDPTLGITAMSRAGVTFTEQQKEQIATLHESGRILQAQRLIMAEVETQVTGTARAVGKTAAGQFNILKETVGNALEKIGARILPLASKLLPSLTKTLTGVLDAVGPAVTRVVEALGAGLQPVLKSLGPALGVLGKVFADLAVQVAPVITLMGGMLSKVFAQLRPHLRPLVNELGKGLLLIFKELRPMLPDLVKSLVELAGALVLIIPPVAKVTAWLVRMSGKLPTMYELFMAASRASQAFGRLVGMTIQKVVGWVTALPRRIGSAASGMWDGIATAFRSTINTIIGWWNSLSFTLPKVHVPGTSVDVGGFTLSTPDLPHLASGGWLAAGRGAVVGERGPEIFVPRRSGDILPSEVLNSLRQTTAQMSQGIERRQPVLIQLLLPNGRVIGQATLNDLSERQARVYGQG